VFGLGGNPTIVSANVETAQSIEMQSRRIGKILFIFSSQVFRCGQLWSAQFVLTSCLLGISFRGVNFTIVVDIDPDSFESIRAARQIRRDKPAIAPA
jgi:hypothetical protein